MKAWHGWTALVAGIAAWDLAVADDEMLSSGYDRFHARHPLLAWFVILATANHLLRISRYDVLHIFDLAAKGNR